MRRVLLVLLCCFSAPIVAHADTITTFQTVGSDAPNDPGRNDTLSGTLAVNVTTGAVTAVDIVLSRMNTEYTTVDAVIPNGPTELDIFIGFPGQTNQAVLEFPISTFAGYTGSGFSLSSPFGVYSSVATPLTTTPEPAGFVLLSTGMAGILAASSRKYRSDSAI